MKKRENSAIKKALEEAEKIFGQPVTFKVRNDFGDLIDATEEDIAKIEDEGDQNSQQQVSRQERGWKFSVSADNEGSTTTFRKTEGGKIFEESVYEPRVKTPEIPEIENRFEEIKDDNSQLGKGGDGSQQGDDKQNFTQHQLVLPPKK